MWTKLLITSVSGKLLNPILQIKFSNSENFILVEDDKVITAERDLVKIFKNHFDKIVENIHIKCPTEFDFDNNPVVNSIKNFS